ncbi:MAG: D-alanine--poly(phosphoribitol) ligase subunit 2 [Oscillospiraceae bacterium]|nr:D-alanine--poly(phosphoribitol) ligase subunit 2 [Oscillospiraceae bacterium]
MLKEIIDIITDISGADEGEIEAGTELFDEGILDSFGVVQLFVQLEALGVNLDVAEFDRDQISTPSKIAALCE